MTPEEQELIDFLETFRDKPMTRQEIRNALDQAYFIGEL